MIGKSPFLLFVLIGALALAGPVLAEENDRDHPRMEKQKNRTQHRNKARGMGGKEMGLRHATRIELYRHLYPVRLVRRHAGELKLTDKQIDKLQNVVSNAQGAIERLKWDVERASQKLVDTIRKGDTKEQVFKQLDRVFKYENKIKKKHLGLMIAVRDILTPQQREQLDTIKQENMKRFGRDTGQPGGPGGPGGPDGPGGPPL